jgi:hypothetical protein
MVVVILDGLDMRHLNMLVIAASHTTRNARARINAAGVFSNMGVSLIGAA